MGDPIPYSECPLCGATLRVDKAGKNRLADHLETCPGRESARGRLEEAAKARRRAKSRARRRSRSYDRGLSPTATIYALLAFLGFVAVVPAWIFWVESSTAALSYEATFLATLVLPATVLLYITGWVNL